MNQTIFVTVFLIIAQVYHSSTNDISDWLIRQGSPFDKPPTISLYKRHVLQPARDVTYSQYPKVQQKSEKRFFFPIYLVRDVHYFTPINQVDRSVYTTLPVHKRRDGTFTSANLIRDVPRVQYIYKDDNVGYRGNGRMFNTPVSYSPMKTQQKEYRPSIMHILLNKQILPFANTYNDVNKKSIKKQEKSYKDNVYIMKMKNKNMNSVMKVNGYPHTTFNNFNQNVKKEKLYPIYKNQFPSMKNTKNSNLNTHFWNTVSNFWKCVPDKCDNLKDSNSNYILSTIQPAGNSYPRNILAVTKKSSTLSSEPLLLAPEYGNMIRNLLSPFISPIIHRRYRRSNDFHLPVINFDNTFLTAKDIHKISKEKLPKPVFVDRFQKYPYYKLFLKDDFLKHSPFKYAEDVRTVPVKTEGGTEFYDTKSSRRCTEVESNVDPIPDRIKSKMPDDHDDENERRKRRVKREFEQNRQQPRLRGLGDKIDCFKEKYFGVDPLDNPFFDEEVIEPPEPLQTPVLGISLRKTPRHSSENVFLYEPFRTTTKLEPIVPITRNKISKDFGKSTAKRSFVLNVPNNKDKTYKNGSSSNNRAVISEQSTISLPAAIFERYTRNQDPQTRVYGDVIGNIKSNLDETNIINSSNYPQAPNNGAEQNNLNNHLPRIYRAYTTKESIQIPITHSRFKRSLNVSQVLSTDNKTKLLPEVANHTAEASVISETVADLDKQPTIIVASPKVYTDIGKEERKILHHVPDEEASDTINYEVPEETTQIKNHRRDYSPITTTKSISPEQLKIEYILKAAEDSELTADTSYNTDSTTNTYNYITQASEDNLDYNQNSETTQPSRAALTYEPNIIPNQKNPNSRRSETIFDVSAYIPRPTYLNSQFLRHNYSSKYNANAVSEADNADEDTELPTTTTENTTVPPSDYIDVETTVETNEANGERVYFENIRHTVERDPSTTPTPTSAFVTSVYSQNKFKESKDNTGDRRSIPLNENTTKKSKEQRNKSRVTTNSRNDDYVSYTEQPRKIKLQNRKRNSKRVRIQKENRPTTTSTTTTTTTTTTTNPLPSISSIFDDTTFEFDTERNDYSYKESIPIPEDYPSTERYTTTTFSNDASRNSRRGRTGRRPQRQQQKRKETVDRVYQSIPRKPKILEKTSKKRKTTVITNSKRYDNNNMDNDYRNMPTERQNRFDYKNDNTEPTVSDNTHEENLSDRNSNNSDNNGAIETADSSNRDVTDKRSPQKGRNKEARRRPPVNEESRFEEDVEEEEIIQERSTPYHGPELAKKINSLSDNEQEGPYRIDTDSDDYRSHSISGDEPKQELSNNRKQYNDYDDDDLRGKSSVTDTYVDSNNYRRTRSGIDPVKDKGISAHVLKSFVSLMEMTTTDKPTYEKDPSKRLYFYAKLHE